MGFFRDRRVLSALVVLVVAAFVLPPVTSGSLGLPVLLLILAMAGFFAMSGLMKRRPPRPRAPSFEVTLLPPPERYRGRAPTTLAALAEALSNARLGMLRVLPDALRLEGERGDFVKVQVANPELVVLADVRVEANSTRQALFVCDALAPLLGAFTFVAPGAELFVDGTTPREDLDRTLHDQFLRSANRPDSARSSPRRYLN